jgi:hypothetical protein
MLGLAPMLSKENDPEIM